MKAYGSRGSLFVKIIIIAQVAVALGEDVDKVVNLVMSIIFEGVIYQSGSNSPP